MSNQLATTQAEFQQNNNFSYDYWLSSYPWLNDANTINNNLSNVSPLTLSYPGFPPTMAFLQSYYNNDMLNRGYIPDPNFQNVYESLLDYFIQNYPIEGTSGQTSAAMPITNFLNAIPTGVSNTVTEMENTASNAVSSLTSGLSTAALYLLIAGIIIVCFYLFINK